MPLISIVVPVYNEQETLEALYEQVDAVFTELPHELELLLVDDGSWDASPAMIRDLVVSDMRVVGMRLSRNFGHEAAIEAGIRAARGDAVIVMDADLQDSPDALPRLVREWEAGADVAYAVRRDRKEGPLQRFAFSLFYRAAQRIMSIDLPRDAGPFCLMSRRATDAVNGMREINRYFPGLRAFAGFRQVAVEVERNPRFAGETKYSFTRRTAGAVNAIVSFSKIPLRLVTLLGFVAAAISILGALWVLIGGAVADQAAPGWVSLMTVVLLVSGVQLVTLGIVGEYVGKVYDEVRARPNFLVAETWRDGEVPDARSGRDGSTRTATKSMVTGDAEPATRSRSKEYPGA